MLCLVASWNLQNYHSFLNLIHFLLANTYLALTCHTTYPWLPLKPSFSFFQTPQHLILHYWKHDLGRGLELILGLSSKVIHHALNNCKSFLVNAKQVSILWLRFPAWYSHVRSGLYQFRKGGFSGGNERGAT